MASDLSDLLNGGPVLPSITCTSAKQVFARLSAAFANTYGLSDRDILAAILEREQLGSTAVGHGVVLPHARIEGLSGPIGGFARLETPIDFDAVDEQPCDLVFMLLAPDGAGADHLRALAKVARVMRQAELRSKLRRAVSEKEMRDIFCGKVESNVA